MKIASLRYDSNKSPTTGGYTRTKDGIRIHPAYERTMMRLWKRSSVMWFSAWDPPKDDQGKPAGPRWYVYYRKTILEDVKQKHLNPDEGKQLLEYLDVLGT